MRYLLAAVLLAGMASAGPAVQQAQTMSQKEVLDLLFKSADTQHRFRDAVHAMGMNLSDWQMGLLTPPWASAAVRAGANRATEDAFDKLVETLRKLIETMAEPLKQEYISLDHHDRTINVAGFIKDLTVYKLSTFKIEEKDVNFFNVSAHLKVSFDTLDLHGTYKVDATASGQLHVFGDGKFDVRLREPTVDVFIRLGYIEEHFTIEELNVMLKMSKLKVIMSNFLGGGEVGDLICGIISDVGPDFLEEYREEVSGLLSSVGMDTINVLLAKVDINTIIDWISSGSIPI
ncbi:O-GlcNAcase NagJ [Frankliniella fusca]|uniref:O-GlcNAcase NagJ n=1 Tax=Frankliniella fusca TaxID=407009 RepID=A0AAE1LJG8_9NEOP|nr:O-GlcNAcase NagJ [Frankliniella fusca]